MKSHIIASLALAACVAGCGSVSYQQFNAQSEGVKAIALISIPNPVHYHAIDYGGKAALFGGVGGAIIATDAKTMSEAMTKAAKEANFDYSREMQATVIERLKRAGFNVVTVRAEREAPQSLVPDYSKVPTAGADALLDIDARAVGYATYNLMDPDFRPHVQVDVRLVSAKTRATLYSEQVMFGYHNPFIAATQLPSDKQYYFKDFGALMADQPRAFAGLRRGMQTIADHVAQRLSSQ